MLAVGPAMDGEFPQHEPPPAGGILYSPPPLQTPLCGSGVQVSPRHPRSASGRDAALAVGCGRSSPFQGLEQTSQSPARQGDASGCPPAVRCVCQGRDGPSGRRSGQGCRRLPCRTGAGASVTWAFLPRFPIFNLMDLVS